MIFLTVSAFVRRSPIDAYFYEGFLTGDYHYSLSVRYLTKCQQLSESCVFDGRRNII